MGQKPWKPSPWSARFRGSPGWVDSLGKGPRGGRLGQCCEKDRHGRWPWQTHFKSSLVERVLHTWECLL